MTPTEVRITELTTMATCERKWWYRYAEGNEDEGSPAMSKGTLFHAWWGAWWDSPNGLAGINVENVYDAIPEDRRAYMTDDILSDVAWMMQRYDDLYLPTRDEWSVVANEQELTGTIAGWACGGRGDMIFKHVPTGDLFLGECKTMKDWRRLEILEVDPQLTHYWDLCRQMGYDIKGILYDAAKTYRWKRDEHPPQDSFQRLFIDRTQEQADAAAEEVEAFAYRKSDLLAGKRLPLRNISAQTCSWCAFRPRCWEELAFPEPDIEIVEDES